MAGLRKAVKKTLIDTDIKSKVLHAMTDHAPADIVRYMSKDCPRTLIDIVNRMEGKVKPTEEVYTPPYYEEHAEGADIKPPEPDTDWAMVKKVIGEIYISVDTTEDELIASVIDMSGCDAEMAAEIVQEMFDEI